MKIDNGFIKALLYVLGAFVVLWVLPKVIAYLIAVLGATFSFLVSILPLILIAAIYLSFSNKSIKDVVNDVKRKIASFKSN